MNAQAKSASRSKVEGSGRLLLRLLHPERWRIILACIAATISGLAELSVFWVIYLLAAEVLSPKPEEAAMIVLALALPGVAIVRLIFLGAASVFSHAAGFSVVRNLRIDLLGTIRQQPLGAVEGRTAALKKTTVDDPTEIEHFVAHTIPDAVSGVAVLVLAIGLLFGVDWRMALASLALIPIAAAMQIWAYRIMGTIAKQWFAADRRATAGLLAYVRGIGTLKAFGRTASSLDDIRGSIETLSTLSRTAMQASAVPFATFFTAVSGSLVFVVPAGLFLHMRGDISTAELILFVTLGAQVSAPLMRLLFANGAMQRLTIALRRIAEILASPLPAPPNIARMPDGTDIRFDDVSFSYDGSRAVLSDVSVGMPEGGVSALVGPSGAGKSTLVRLIARYWDVDRGAVRIGGADLREVPEARLRPLMSVVFQNPFLFHGTIRENLEIAAPGTRKTTVEEVIQTVGLGDLLHRLPGGLDGSIGDRGMQLSGGERQRLAIARALLKDAPILLLDEATAFSDPENELAIQQAISKLTAGRTVVVVAHRLATVQSASLIAVVDEGRIDVSGDHAEVLDRSPTYQALWASQNRAMAWSLGSATVAAC